MECITIRHVEAAGTTGCPKCGERHAGRSGLGLFTKDHDQPMCRSCGRKWAPTMAALLELAVTAERVGRCGRHLLTPPMESLLALARAAENYSHAAPR